MKTTRLFDVILASLIVLPFIAPLLWMVAASLRPLGGAPDPTAFLPPWPPAWQNYLELFHLLPWGRYGFNSLLITLLSTLLTLLTASWAGLALALLPAYWRGRLVVFSILLQIVPATALWLGRFWLFARLGWTNTWLPMLAPALMGGNPLFVLFFYWSFRRIGRALFESAQLDGAGWWALWSRLALPLSRPALLTVAMLSFLTTWNDFLTPLLTVRSQNLYTLPLGLLQLEQLSITQTPLLMAGAVMITLPPLLVFLILHRSLLSWGERSS